VFVAEVVEDSHVVGAFAPDDFMVLFVGFVDNGEWLGVLFQPDAGLFAELFDIGKVAHEESR
jgi:hypothetical protein